jgi:hypothetical protein
MNNCKLRRLPDWQSRFGKWHEFAMRTPFEWGTWDCGIFCVTCLQAQTGIKVSDVTWDDALTARRLYAKNGLIEIFSETLEGVWGLESLAILKKAGDGFPCVLRPEKETIGGIVYHGKILAPATIGAVSFNINYAVKIWGLN